MGERRGAYLAPTPSLIPKPTNTDSSVKMRFAAAAVVLAGAVSAQTVYSTDFVVSADYAAQLFRSVRRLMEDAASLIREGKSQVTEDQHGKRDLQKLV